MKMHQDNNTPIQDIDIPSHPMNRTLLWIGGIVGLIVMLLAVGFFLFRNQGKAIRAVLYHHQIRHIQQMQTDALAIDDRVSNIETFFTIIKINKNKILLEDKRAMTEELRTLATLNAALERDVTAYKIDRSLRWHMFRQEAVDQFVDQAAITTASVDQFIRNAEYMMYSASKKNDLFELIDEQIKRIHTSIQGLGAVTF